MAASVLVPEWRSAAADISHDIPSSPGMSAVPERPDLRHAIGPVLVPDDDYLRQASETARSALESAIERLSGLGITVQRIAIFGDIEEFNALHKAMIARDFAEIQEFWVHEHIESYHPRTRELIETGREVSDELRERAREGRIALRERLENALRRHGARLWIAPATVDEAPEGIESTGDPIMNLPWTYSGLPTVSLPVDSLRHGTGAHGLPLGVQFAGTFGGDEELIAQIRALAPHV